MLALLRTLFLTILVSMLAVTSWASWRCPLFEIPREVFTHPWFVATLFDAYWAFVAFYVWVAWKERGALARVLWFVAIILLGNIVIAAYMLRELFTIHGGSSLDPVFTRQNRGTLPLPGTLVTLGIVVYLLA